MSAVVVDMNPRLKVREEDVASAKAWGSDCPDQAASVTPAAAAKHLEISRHDMERSLCGDRSFFVPEIFALKEWLGGSWDEWVGDPMSTATDLAHTPWCNNHVAFTPELIGDESPGVCSHIWRSPSAWSSSCDSPTAAAP